MALATVTPSEIYLSAAIFCELELAWIFTLGDLGGAEAGLDEDISALGAQR